jgi:hypothetical protein
LKKAEGVDCDSKYKVHYPVTYDKIKVPLDFKVDVPCDLIHAADRISAKDKFDEFAKGIDGLKESCPWADYDVMGGFNSLLNSVTGLSLLDLSIGLEDSSLMKAMNCAKAVMNVGLRTTKLAASVVGFSDSGTIGMLDTAIEALGVDKLQKPVEVVKTAGRKSEVFEDGEWNSMQGVFDKGTIPQPTDITEDVYGIPTAPVDVASVDTVIKNKSAKHYTGILSEDELLMVSKSKSVLAIA